MKFNRIKFIFIISTAFFFSCKQNKTSTDAEVSQAKEVTKVETSTKYLVDTSKSVATWIGSKPTGKHDGIIPVSKGSIAISDGKIVGGTIELSVENLKNVDLVNSPDMKEKIEQHLQSPDFFDTKNFPTATFEITSVSAYQNEDSVDVKLEYESEYKPANSKEYMVSSPTHKVSGNLTMKGKTFSITFPAKININEESLTANAKFNIDRTQWGLTYSEESSALAQAKDKFIYNTVNVGFELFAKLTETKQE